MVKKDSGYIVSRAAELLRESEYAVTVTDFMTPAEIAEVNSNLISRSGSGYARCFFWGGCRGAERCTAVFLPEWYVPDDAPEINLPLDTLRRDAFAEYLEKNPDVLSEIPISAIRVKASGFRELTHRDFLGGLLSLGIDRSAVGDIAVISPSEAFIFVLSKIAPFITSELTKIGRDGVRAEVCSVNPTFVIPRRYEEMEIAVASARLDGIVRALIGKSREISADMIRDGLVEKNYISTEDVSAEVHPEDIVTIRGFGKYVIDEQYGQTKSGRLKIRCRKYA